jgi:hypothetical protein
MVSSGMSLRRGVAKKFEAFLERYGQFVYGSPGRITPYFLD